jgi:hypothetical protein
MWQPNRIWLHAVRLDRRVWSSLAFLFLLYLCVLLLFGWAYQTVYRRNPKSFVFGAEIAQSQSQRYMEETRASLASLQSKRETLALLLRRLASD